MKGLDTYGKGRFSVIIEMINFIQKEIDSAIVAKYKAESEGDKFKACHLSGVIKSGNKYKQELDNKLKKLKLITI